MKDERWRNGKCSRRKGRSRKRGRRQGEKKRKKGGGGRRKEEEEEKTENKRGVGEEIGEKKE